MYKLNGLQSAYIKFLLEICIGTDLYNEMYIILSSAILKYLLFRIWRLFFKELVKILEILPKIWNTYLDSEIRNYLMRKIWILVVNLSF